MGSSDELVDCPKCAGWGFSYKNYCWLCKSGDNSSNGKIPAAMAVEIALYEDGAAPITRIRKSYGLE